MEHLIREASKYMNTREYAMILLGLLIGSIVIISFLLACHIILGVNNAYSFY